MILVCLLLFINIASAFRFKKNNYILNNLLELHSLSPFSSFFIQEDNYKNKLSENLLKMSILSKLIYEYNYVNDKNKKSNYYIEPNINKKTNLTFSDITNNNIYFSSKHFATELKINNFYEKTLKYFTILNKIYPETEIFGYFQKFNSNRLHSLILINHRYKEIIVVFRGSQYIDEWINNIFISEKKILFHKKKELNIHRGMYNMYINDNIDNDIVYILKNLFIHFPKYKKIFTGHSKGAINSILLSLELLDKLKENYYYDIYMFGVPLIFNKELANYLHKHKKLTIYNILNKNDIITTFPLYNKFHIGLEIFLNNDNIKIIPHKEPYKIGWKESLLNIHKLFSNHDLDNYIAKILKEIRN